MSLITWKDEYSVGVAAVDLEHRELIELINDLDAAMQRQATHATVVQALGEIFARISAHFALEEKIMRDAGYADFGPHKADHESLLDQLADIIHAVEIGDKLDDRDLSSRLNRWFTGHFGSHDAKLHRRL